MTLYCRMTHKELLMMCNTVLNCMPLPNCNHHQKKGFYIFRCFFSANDMCGLERLILVIPTYVDHIYNMHCQSLFYQPDLFLFKVMSGLDSSLACSEERNTFDRWMRNHVVKFELNVTQVHIYLFIMAWFHLYIIYSFYHVLNCI